MVVDVILEFEKKMLFDILFEIKLNSFFIGHILKSSLFVSVYKWHQRNILDHNSISILIGNGILNCLKYRELVFLTRHKENDHNDDQSQQLKPNNIVLVVCDYDLRGYGKVLIQNIVLIDQMTILGKLNPGIDTIGIKVCLDE